MYYSINLGNKCEHIFIVHVHVCSYVFHNTALYMFTYILYLKNVHRKSQGYADVKAKGFKQYGCEICTRTAIISPMICTNMT